MDRIRRADQVARLNRGIEAPCAVVKSTTSDRVESMCFQGIVGWRQERYANIKRRGGERTSRQALYSGHGRINSMHPVALGTARIWKAFHSSLPLLWLAKGSRTTPLPPYKCHSGSIRVLEPSLKRGSGAAARLSLSLDLERERVCVAPGRAVDIPDLNRMRPILQH